MHYGTRKCAFCECYGWWYETVETPECSRKSMRLCDFCHKAYLENPNAFAYRYEEHVKVKKSVRNMLGPKRVDTQRQKVYSWGNAIGKLTNINNHRLSLDECQEISNIACKLYDISPVLAIHKKTHSSANCGWSWRHNRTVIRLPDWAMCLKTVLHEVSHAIADGDKHGPKFMRVYVDLLDRFGLIKTKQSCAMARKEYGIKIAPRNKAPKPKNRVTIRKAKWLKERIK